MHIGIEAANFPTSQEFWKYTTKKIEFLPIQMHFLCHKYSTKFYIDRQFIQTCDRIYIEKHIDYVIKRVDQTESR